jgi:hypothetical protein
MTAIMPSPAAEPSLTRRDLTERAKGLDWWEKSCVSLWILAQPIVE